ncbi:hypothetical protein NP233_g10435 [Leucocoprinus birnbaumii]|uniref:Uncharacterized protein n=1 Tax=Leucocoprinus birnbaumii TaxID=56174 RepID=A0AAD5YM63_9AGAR|nr:hypothetical protein NP233_g10435 [Leucocoprinus birnbaumii]
MINNDPTTANDSQPDASSFSSTYTTPPTPFPSPALTPQPSSQITGASDMEDIPPLDSRAYATKPLRSPQYQLGKATRRLRAAHILSHSAMRWRESGGRCSSWLPRFEHPDFFTPIRGSPQFADA